MVNHFQESKVEINKSQVTFYENLDRLSTGSEIIIPTVLCVQTSHDIRRNFMKSNICFGEDKCDYSRESDNLKNHQKLPPLPKH